MKRSITAPTTSPCFKDLTMVSTAEGSEGLVVALTATASARTLNREVRRMVLFGFCGKDVWVDIKTRQVYSAIFILMDDLNGTFAIRR